MTQRGQALVDRVAALRARVGVTTRVVTYTEQEIAERAAYAALAALARRWRIRSARAAHLARAAARAAVREHIRQTTRSRLAAAVRSRGCDQDAATHDPTTDVPRSGVRSVSVAADRPRAGHDPAAPTRIEPKGLNR